MLVFYNIAEAVLAVVFGLMAGSIALLGFGFDSVIEVAAASILIWRLRAELKAGSSGATCNAERRALLFVGLTFLILATFVTSESVLNLVHGDEPGVSVPGMVVAALSLILMPILAHQKFKIARALGSRALRADAIETAVCSYLSLALLAGLGLRAWLGWWWADAVAALAMVPLMLKEGVEAISESRFHAKDCPTVPVPRPALTESPDDAPPS